MSEADRHARDAGAPSEEAGAHGLPWRRALRRELAWILVLKFAALALLWALFFRGPHHSLPDAQALSERFAVPGAHSDARRGSPHD
jgi:hypothetical protein